MKTQLKHVFHIHNRLGFGINYIEAKELQQVPLNKIINTLITESSIGQYITSIKKDEIPSKKEATQDGISKKDFNKLINDKLDDLNLSWIKMLLTTKNVLLEKQTLFWHNHFACRVRNPYFMQELNNTHRKFAFGSFRDLLIEVSKSPAMITYLNNLQNKKEHPNENFAREVMELFTLGRGNYTEQDIKEAARAFTGWSIDKDTQEFIFREKIHDNESKTIFGQTGNFKGEDVINMIISNKKTAYYIARKMYKYYVNELVNEKRVNELADFYYQNQYNTGALLKKIISSPWFFDDENIGSNIKSPIEYIVNISRTFNIKFNKENVLINLQRNLGMFLFNPPNVAGWPGGKNFIDSSTLLLRMKLPSLVLNNGIMETDKETDDPDGPGNGKPTENKKFETEVVWSKILEEHKELELEQLMQCLLAKMPTPSVIQKIKQNEKINTKEAMIKIVSLPEYSLV
ncbi:MAG: DUF1800 domain-containing protein [Bacteroidetes bacterium]|nr:DUF1800 domain-containing protein [Bacteroidota bacterium]